MTSTTIIYVDGGSSPKGAYAAYYDRKHNKKGPPRKWQNGKGHSSRPFPTGGHLRATLDRLDVAHKFLKCIESETRIAILILWAIILVRELLTG